MYVIENVSASNNNNLTNANIFFYKPEKDGSCACGRNDGMPSTTSIAWTGPISFNKRTATQFIKITHPQFPNGTGCMQVALYGMAGWYLDKEKQWACFRKNVKKTITVTYHPAPKIKQ